MADQWWLVTLDQYGNPKLVDGAHSTRAGVEQAAYLHTRLGLSTGAKHACARIEISEVEPVSHRSNESALSSLNAIGLKP